MDSVLHFFITGWGVIAEMAPYLLFGFLVAGVLSECLSPEWIERHLGRRGVASILKASAFGVPLPLCSCGVIPVGASLRRHGASKGATTAFLLSTPQTGVDSIAITVGMLGPVFAVFRAVAALVTGFVGGMLVDLLDDAKDDAPLATDAESQEPQQEKGGCCGDSCAPEEEATGGAVQRAAQYGFVALPRDIGRSLVVGILVATILGVAVPPNALVDAVGDGPLLMLAMMAFGLPLYVCATASVPIASALWLHQGVSPGAVLVFLVTGPATNAATMAVIWRTLGRRSLMIYLGTVAAMALASGLLLDTILSAGAHPMEHEHGGDGGLWEMAHHAAGILLVAVLIHAMLPRRRTEDEMPPATPGNDETTVVRLTVTGMTCSHCATSVKRALEQSPGVESATVDLDAKRASVRGAALDSEALAAAVRALGYEATAEA